MSLADPAESVFAERLLRLKRGMRSGKMIKCTDLKKPTAYLLLDKLLAAGWISKSAEQAGHRPARRVFAITPAGEVAFQRLLPANLAGWSRARFPADSGLAFVDALDSAEASQLPRWRGNAMAAELAAARAAPAHADSLQWLVEHQVRHLAGELKWLDTLLARRGVTAFTSFILRRPGPSAGLPGNPTIP